MFMLILAVAFRAFSTEVEVYAVRVKFSGYAGLGATKHFVCRDVVNSAALFAQEMCVGRCVAIEVGIAFVDGEHQRCVLLSQEFQSVIDGGL